MNIKTMLLGGSALLLAACASVKTTPSHTMGEEYIQKALVNGRDVVYFIRGDDLLQDRTVNVFIDGHFATSLPANHHRVISICPHVTNISVVETDSKLDYSRIRQIKNPFSLTQSNIYYLSVALTDNNQPQLVQLTEKEGKALLKKTKETVRTMPRLEDVECQKRQLFAKD